MSQHETFHYRTLDELRQQMARLDLDLDASDDPSILLEPLRVGAHTLPNRLVTLPMEGCDSTPEGAPDDLTFRRYQRFAQGGAGLLWFEATAVCREGRANPRQLWLQEHNIAAFASLVEETRRAARQSLGEACQPLLLVQLTHSGRYSRPGRAPVPILAHHSPFLDPTHKLPAEYPLITDGELEQLEEDYVEAARCAWKAGFDGVDIKACHRYLISELHASFTRENSRYGGPSFENRSRFFRNVVARIRQAHPKLLVTSRMNVYDAIPHPYGFGMSPENPAQPDLAEPIALVQFLRDQGAPLVNITLGNPYYNPHVNRPYDLPILGGPVPAEHPLEGVNRFIQIVRRVQESAPNFPVIGGGYSWLRQFFPNVAAANIRKGWVSLVGFGRLAFAYPDLVRDLRQSGRLQADKVCVACSACTQIMRDGGCAGCVPRDPTVYEPIYKHGREEALDAIQEMARTCRQCNDPTCVGKCPAKVNIPKFVNHIVKGEFREAYETLREANILAATCGYVCPSEEQCEAGCLRQHYSFQVPIRKLQRWVGQKAIEEGWVSAPRPEAVRSGKRVAVIGAGPAGLSAAARLAALGHEVLILDKAPQPGGAARAIIPADRLPDAVLKREILDLLASYGPWIQCRTIELGPGYTLEHVLQERFHAVLVAVGLSQSATLPAASRPQSGVVGALDFLRQSKKGQTFSGSVLVLGGGNTALDAAIAAQKAGAHDVSIVYRRSFAEMPAWPEERDRALQAGVHFLTLTAPLYYLAQEDGTLTGLKVVRTRLGKTDASGRHQPEAIPGTEHALPANLVIEALGQVPEASLKAALPGIRFLENGLIAVKPDTLETSRPGVFAAGDIINGGTTIARAVAEGAVAARHIDDYLNAEPVAISIKN